MKKTICNLFTACLIFPLIISCEAGKDGLNSLISTSIEQPGSNCAGGGIQVNYGLDSNDNGILDSFEIQNSDYICNDGGESVMLDNLTRIPLGTPDFQSCDNYGWAMAPFESWQLHDFNINDYAGVSSVLFVPSLVNYNEGSTVEARLYNVTDNVPIEGSTVSHDGVDYVFKYSSDILTKLPDHPVTLAIQIRKKEGAETSCVGTGTYSYLYIMRE